jgi:ABC-2 type transport system permease protein
MKVVLKIAKAELNTLFYSPIAWLLAIIFLFQCGLAYTSVVQEHLTYQGLGGVYLTMNRTLTMQIFPGFNGIFTTVVQKLYLYIPLLTMGLISREISSGTIKLLYSSPIKVSQIVFGKFMAMMGYNFLLVLIVSGFVITGIFNIHHVDVIGPVRHIFAFMCILGHRSFYVKPYLVSNCCGYGYAGCICRAAIHWYGMAGY